MNYFMYLCFKEEVSSVGCYYSRWAILFFCFFFWPTSCFSSFSASNFYKVSFIYPKYFWKISCCVDYLNTFKKESIFIFVLSLPFSKIYLILETILSSSRACKSSSKETSYLSAILSIISKIEWYILNYFSL